MRKLPPRTDELDAIDFGFLDPPGERKLCLLLARQRSVGRGQIVLEVTVKDAAKATTPSKVTLGGQNLDRGQH